MISVVIPIHDEKDNLNRLHDELIDVLNSLNDEYEIIFVDDGSRDHSTPVLVALQLRHSNTHVIQFSRNYGQTAALVAGIKASLGDVIVTLDGDLQNDPRDIPRLLDALTDTTDLVCGRRSIRPKEYWGRQLPSQIANFLIRVLTRAPVHDTGCGLKVLRASYAKNLYLTGEMHRLIPVLVAVSGGTIREVNVRFRPRKFGNSHYGMTRVFRVFFDLILIAMMKNRAHSQLVFFGSASLGAIIIGGSILMWYALRGILFDFDLANRPMMLLGVLLIIIGIQVLFSSMLVALVVLRINQSSLPDHILMK
jgi:glycosyltransferase involved in cell wall biosynthesis